MWKYEFDLFFDLKARTDLSRASEAVSMLIADRLKQHIEECVLGFARKTKVQFTYKCLHIALIIACSTLPTLVYFEKEHT